MPKTVSNQNVIHINKPRYTGNFLQVGIEELQEVVKKFNKSEVALYLYLCGNANGFDLALSQVAFENAYGFKKTAYYNAFDKLEKAGYLVRKGEGSNIYDFYTTPKLSAVAENKNFPLQRNENSATEENYSAVEEKNSAGAIEKQINTYKDIYNKQLVSTVVETTGGFAAQPPIVKKEGETKPKIKEVTIEQVRALEATQHIKLDITEWGCFNFNNRRFHIKDYQPELLEVQKDEQF